MVGAVIKQSLKICTYNVENLFLSQEDLPPAGQALKSKKKTQALAEVIQDIDADVYALSEVGGAHSLNKLNQDFLGNQYLALTLPGNSKRNIHLAYLIHKRVQLISNIKSNKERSIGFNYPFEEKCNLNRKQAGLAALYSSHKMSRDVLELHLYSNEKAQKNQDDPQFIFLNTHLKSQWDREGHDFRGEQRRKHEFQLLLKLKSELELKHPSSILIMLGDFNGNATTLDTDPEFQSYYQSQNNSHDDVLELLKLPAKQRCTFVGFTQKGEQIIHQLDYIFLPRDRGIEIIKENSGVYYYKNEDQSAQPLPGFKNAKERHPSDHYPLCAHLQLEVSK